MPPARRTHRHSRNEFHTPTSMTSLLECKWPSGPLATPTVQRLPTSRRRLTLTPLYAIAPFLEHCSPKESARSRPLLLPMKDLAFLGPLRPPRWSLRVYRYSVPQWRLQAHSPGTRMAPELILFMAHIQRQPPCPPEEHWAHGATLASSPPRPRGHAPWQAWRGVSSEARRCLWATISC